MDGLSAAASVAGIVSLAIQVAQSLVDFYSAYKNQKSEIAHTIKKLERLLGMLEILRSQLADRTFLADEQDTLKSIEDAIQDCEVCVHELQDQCDKLKDSSTSGIRASAHASVRRLAYPFRKGTLQTLDDSVEEIVDHLSLALQVLQQKDIYRVQNDTEEVKSLLDLVRADQISQDVRSWLKAPDVAVNYNEACKRRHSGTGSWLVKGTAFSTWLTKHNSFLWLRGFAGCGKSVLCSTAIQHTFRHRRSSSRIGIAFFFFTFDDHGKQDTSAMLRALVLQLSGQISDGHEILSRLHNSHRNGSPPDEALMGCLRQLVRSFDNTFIILDALDESPRDEHRGDTLQALIDMRAWSEPGLHLLATSRDEPDIREAVRHGFHVTPEDIVSLKNAAVDGDIASFISASLRSNRQLQRWKDHHDQIKDALTERAKGVFRWVECQFIALASCPTSKIHLEKMLASLPRTLDQTYQRMLQNINDEFKEDARRLLTLLCCAKKPLTIPEVIEAIAVELGEYPRLRVDARLKDEDDIHRICPGLIEVYHHPNPRQSNGFDDYSVTVRIAHFSVQEYLESERIHQYHPVAMFSIRKPHAHTEIACICLTYLLELASPEWKQNYPLTLYAARWWHEHYYDGNQDQYQLQHQALRLFRNSKGELENWVRIWDLDWFHGVHRGEIPSPIYYASLLGFDSLISELLWTIPSTGLLSEGNFKLLNIQGGRFGNPLQAASKEGHEKTVQLLLDKGADIHAQGGYYGNALQAASVRCNEKIVQLLLDKGAADKVATKRQSSCYSTIGLTRQTG